MKQRKQLSESELISEMAQDYEDVMSSFIVLLQDLFDLFKTYDKPLTLEVLENYYEELKKNCDKLSIHCTENIDFIKVALKIFRDGVSN